MHKTLWGNISGIQKTLSITDQEFSSMIGMKKGFSAKKRRKSELPANILFRLSERFNLSLSMLLRENSIDFKVLCKSYQSQNCVMKKTYMAEPYIMISSLESALEMAKRKSIYDFVLRNLQISNIQNYDQPKVGMKLIYDVFDTMEPFLEVKDIASISLLNFEKFSKSRDMSEFSQISSSKLLFESFVDYMNEFETLFSYEVLFSDEKEIIVGSRSSRGVTQCNILTKSDSITLHRLYFASMALTLNGGSQAKASILSSIASGASSDKFRFEYT